MVGLGGGLVLGLGCGLANGNFLLAFANLLLGVVASISGSFFCVCFLGVGNLGWVMVGNPAGVGTGGVSFSLVFNFGLMCYFSVLVLG